MQHFKKWYGCLGDMSGDMSADWQSMQVAGGRTPAEA